MFFRNSYRPMDLFLKKYFGKKKLIGIEVGVWKGEHAKQMLKLLNLKTLYLVDDYHPFTEGNISYSKADMDKIMFEARRKLWEYYPRPLFFDVPSTTFTTKYYTPKLDFVYIDATHTYEAVKADAKAYYKILPEGAVLGGHDFEDRFQGLIRAVSEVAYETKSKLHFKSPDWWIIKGEPNEDLFS